MKSEESNRYIVIGEQQICIEDVVSVAKNKAYVQLSKDKKFCDSIEKGSQFLDDLLKKDGVIYGVTTGFGDSVTEAIPAKFVGKLSTHLSRFHGCGMGKDLTQMQTKAVLVTRLASLVQGFSGVRLKLIEAIIVLIENDIMPRIPEEGSVGASGDLTPLSYLAAVLMGERDVFFQNKLQKTSSVFKKLNIKPLQLKPKEGLAIMNGTAVMTGLACLAYDRAQYLTRLSARITSMASIALRGNAYHFEAFLAKVKPHPGQAQITAWIYSDLVCESAQSNSPRLQDRYSIRCAPHVIGVLQDSLPWMRQFIEIELNSANDNPIIDGENERVMHGGHFYGGHIAFAMDSLKNCVANIADLLDRQMALLVDTKYNNGLPHNLSGANKKSAMINHGFKAVQIAVSAWTAEALKLTMPASVFSRSTECHNQDKVSMGTIAARDCLRIIELTEQVIAAVLLTATQGIELRINQNELAEQHLSAQIQTMKKQVFEHFDILEDDRPLEGTLRHFVSLIQQQEWSLYDD